MDLEKAAERLRYDLAMTEMLSAPSGDGGTYIKFLVVQLLALKIKMYPENGPHKEPHIHIDYGREHHVASYAIRNGKRLAGDLDRKYDLDVRAWIKKHRDELMDIWTAAKAGGDPEHLLAALREPK
jgi:hypothetical protein